MKQTLDDWLLTNNTDLLRALKGAADTSAVFFFPATLSASGLSLTHTVLYAAALEYKCIY